MFIFHFAGRKNIILVPRGRGPSLFEFYFLYLTIASHRSTGCSIRPPQLLTRLQCQIGTFLKSIFVEKKKNTLQDVNVKIETFFEFESKFTKSFNSQRTTTGPTPIRPQLHVLYAGIEILY